MIQSLFELWKDHNYPCAPFSVLSEYNKAFGVIAISFNHPNKLPESPDEVRFVSNGWEVIPSNQGVICLKVEHDRKYPNYES